ncbi:hypothetical protein [Actinoplanes flavus]|uniref:Uncharacterized protein n=1 Tax=Actinoplanes flavus TaxID=2820290 RepID=A0ABS3UET0_9ACTN|nr:hypothetical protein [Actinoplanes flavus]MBO3736741.1 hypothetical protein [Actinoplanes flavus]
MQISHEPDVRANEGAERMRHDIADWPLVGSHRSRRAASADLVRLPMPTSADLQRQPDESVHYAVTSIDNRGRMAAATLLHTLGWKPGDLIKFTVDSQRLITATRITPPQRVGDAAPSRAIRIRGHLNMPATARHRAAIAPGDRLLLAADNTGTLRIFSPRMVSLLLRPHFDPQSPHS